MEISKTPNDIEAEQRVLGAILLDNKTLKKARHILVADDFFRERHRLIFLAMTTLADRNEPQDLITLTNELKHMRVHNCFAGRDRSGLELVEGAQYLGSLIDAVPTGDDIERDAKVVKVASKLRAQIQEAMDKAIELMGR